MIFAILLAACSYEDPRRADITHSLLEPYAAAVASGEWADARKRFTGPGYAASEVVFLAGQARNRDTYGALKAIRLESAAIEEVEDPVLGDVFRVQVVWEGERASAHVVLDLDHREGWHIVRSYAWPPDGVALERVF